MVIKRPNALMPFLPKTLTKISEYLSSKYVTKVTINILATNNNKGTSPDSTIIVVIVPGPPNRGVAIGTIATSAWDSRDLVLGNPPSISIAIAIRSIPP
ncbi:MAG: hypothetical protein QXX14_01260, partial [Candidatus Methanomethyliaceae archaeon]